MKLRITLLLILCFSTFSCKNMRVERQIRNFTSSRIVIPDGLQGMGGKRDSCAVQNVYGRMVIYFDSLGCNSCRVNKLYEWNEILAFCLDSVSGCAVNFIFSPAGDENKLRDILCENGQDYPIFIDVSGDFPRMNPSIPTDNRFHVFLLDGSGRVVLVGNPVYNLPLWDLYKATLRSLCENKGALPQ